MKRTDRSNTLILKQLIALTLALALAASPLAAGTKRGDRFVEEGRRAEVSKKWDEALDLYEKALLTDPADTAYQMAVHRVRFQAGQLHVDRGQKLRSEGKLEEALNEFRRAFAIDPASSIAETEMRRTYQMIQREKNKQEGRTETEAEERGLTPVQIARRDAEERAAAMTAMPELRPLTPMVTNLKISNQPVKVIFETLGKLSGINVLFDSEFADSGKRQSIDLNNVTLEQALDYVGILTKTFWKPLSGNAIFVTNDNATKRRDYEEHVTRVFYLNNVTSPQELQEAMTAMRTVTDVRKIFPFNSQSALVVRGTADQVALAEKILLDLDKPKPEVVVDVLVMEASRSRTRDWALSPTFGGAPNLSVTAAPAKGSESLTLNQLKTINGNDWTVNLPGAQFTALLSRGFAKILQSPQVRATDGQKATLRLGDRYPFATGSFQPGLGVGGGGISPLVSTQFQYQDVGVNVDVTPRIHGADEVSMQIQLEVSSIKERINVGGLEQPVIGQRKVEHIIRVREGEATLIGGLMQANERRSRSGIPGLMHIPGIGRWLSSDKVENSDAELLVVLIPHIVRAPEISPVNLKSVATGTDAIWKVTYAPKPGAPEPAAQPPVAKPAQTPPAPPAPPVPTDPPADPAAAAPSTDTTPPPRPAPPPADPSAAIPGLPPGLPGLTRPGAVPAQPASGESTIAFVASTAEPALNSLVTVNLNIDSVEDLFAAPMRVAYDPKVLRLVDVRRGPFLAQDGQGVSFEFNNNAAEGSAAITLQRVAGAGGVSGSGSLLTLLFQAVGRGAGEISLPDISLRDAKLQPIRSSRNTVSVTVK